jgi:hypothetical protein
MPLWLGILSLHRVIVRRSYPAEVCVSLSPLFFQSPGLQLGNVLNYLELHTFSAQRHYLDVLFE